MADVSIKDKSKEVVLVTGITGYVAIETTKVLADSGWTNIRGTCRSTKKAEASLSKLLAYCKEKGVHVQLFEADLEKKASIQKAITEPFQAPGGLSLNVTRVLHIASPFVNNPKRAEDLLTPAIDGTLVVLEACSLSNSHVKQMVLTSSMYAVLACWTPELATERNLWDPKTGIFPLTDQSWSYIKPRDQVGVDEAYPLSKTLAEQAAWNFWKNSPNAKAKFGLSAVNPGAIFGVSDARVLPYKSIKGSETQGEFLTNVVTGKLTQAPHFKVPVTDVEDVAACHVACLGNSKALGERFPLVNEHSIPWAFELNGYVTAALQKDPHLHYLGQQVKPLVGTEAPKWLCTILDAFGLLGNHFLFKAWGLDFKVQPALGRKTEEVLGVKLTPIADTFVKAIRNAEAIRIVEEKHTVPSKQEPKESKARLAAASIAGALLLGEGVQLVVGKRAPPTKLGSVAVGLAMLPGVMLLNRVPGAAVVGFVTSMHGYALAPQKAAESAKEWPWPLLSAGLCACLFLTKPGR